MATRTQPCNGLLRKIPLHRNRAVVIHDAPAGRITGRLGVLPVVGNTGSDLQVALSLHRSAHQSKAHQWFRTPGQETRDDGVKRPFPWCDLVRMTGLQGESPAAIVQSDTGVGHHDARAEALEVGLDEGHHHAVLVSGRQVHRAAAVR